MLLVTLKLLVLKGQYEMAWVLFGSPGDFRIINEAEFLALLIRVQGGSNTDLFPLKIEGDSASAIRWVEEYAPK